MLHLFGQLGKPCNLSLQLVLLAPGGQQLVAVVGQSLGNGSELASKRAATRQEAIQNGCLTGGIAGQFEDFVLAVNLDTRQEIARLQGRNLSRVVFDDRGLPIAARHQIAPAVLRARNHREFDATAGAQVRLDDFIMLPPRGNRARQHVEHVAQAFDQRRLSGPAPADHGTQMCRQLNADAVEVAAMEVQILHARVVRLRRRPESNAGIRVLERSEEALEARSRHLDPAARARIGQVIGLSHVLGVQQRDAVRALIVRVFVADDLLVVRGQVLERPGDLASLDERLVLPDVGEPATILVQAQQAAGAGHVRRVPETAEIENDLRQVETCLVGRLHRILGIRER